MADPVTIERPADRLTVTFKDEQRILKMPFARLNNCLRVLGDPDNLPMMLIDPDTSEAIIKVMFAPAPQSEDDIVDWSKVFIGEDDLSMDETDRILIWVRDHLAAFFLKRFQQVGEQFKRLEPAAGALVLSLTGSANSSSSEPAAGPST